MLNNQFPPWPCFSKQEADAVSKVLLSNKVNYWTGEETRMFEKEFAEFADCKYSVALSNGTLALDLALKALGVGPGDEVVVTPRTFIASVSCVVTAGATPVFADVDAGTQNISAQTIAAVITEKTKAIIVVHLAGMPADMDPIMSLAEKKNLKVIEDCAQAHGAKYKGKSVGSIGHIGAWSFCQDKIMTTGGEGGMVTTNDRSLWSTMWSYKDHGKSWDAVYNQNLKGAAGYRWLHESFGTNWRMTELQGVLGRIQLTKMEKWNSLRRRYAETIWSACRDVPWIRVPDCPSYIRHGAYKAYVFIKPDEIPNSWSRDKILEYLGSNGIPVYSGSCSEVYLEKAFSGTSFRPKERLPMAKFLGETSLMFLVHPTLNDQNIQHTVDAIRELHKQMFLNEELSNQPDNKDVVMG